MSTAAEAVQPVNHEDVEVPQVLVGNAVDIPRELPRRAIHFATEEPHAAELLLGRAGGWALREDARGRVVGHAVDARDVPDHVVVEDGLDPPPLVARDLRHPLAAVEALLLAREACEDDRGGEAVAGTSDHSGGFENPGHPARVVVRPGGAVDRVHDVGDPRVDVAGHDHVAARIRCAAEDRDHAHDPGGIRNASLAGDHGPLVRHFEAAAARRRDRIELGLDPAPGGADPARGGERVGERMARAEADQRPDVALDAVRGDRFDEREDPRVASGREGLLRRGG